VIALEIHDRSGVGWLDAGEVCRLDVPGREQLFSATTPEAQYSKPCTSPRICDAVERMILAWRASGMDV
jgi:hypothetical protein